MLSNMRSNKIYWTAYQLGKERTTQNRKKGERTTRAGNLNVGLRRYSAYNSIKN